jgi:hypothetical protein
LPKKFFSFAFVLVNPFVNVYRLNLKNRQRSFLY